MVPLCLLPFLVGCFRSSMTCPVPFSPLPYIIPSCTPPTGQPELFTFFSEGFVLFLPLWHWCKPSPECSPSSPNQIFLKILPFSCAIQMLLPLKKKKNLPSSVNLKPSFLLGTSMAPCLHPFCGLPHAVSLYLFVSLGCLTCRS